MTYIIYSLKIYIYKPTTNKNKNSKIYIIYLNFHKLQKKKKKFIKFYKPFFNKFKHKYLTYQP